MKRFKSIVTAFLMASVVMTSFNTVSFAGGNQNSSTTFQERIADLQSEFYDGKDLTPEYTYDSSWTCVAYAKRIAYGVFNTKWSTWERYVRTPDNEPYNGVDSTLENLSVGDTLTFSRRNGGVHMIFVTRITGDTIYFTDSNWTNYVNGYKPNTIRWNASISKDKLLNNDDYYYHSYRHAGNYSDVFGGGSGDSGSTTYPIDTTDKRVKLEWTKTEEHSSTGSRGKGSNTGIYFKAVYKTLPGNGFKIRAVYENGDTSSWFHINDYKAYVINHNKAGQANQLVWLETWYPSEWGYNWGNVTIDWSPDYTEQSGVVYLE